MAVKLNEVIEISSLEEKKFTERDLQEFVHALLHSRPYRKSYKCMGGACTVTFQTVLFRVKNLIRQAAAGEAKSNDEFRELMGWYTLACSLDSIVPSDDYPDAVPIALGSLDSVRKPADVKARFEELVNRVQVGVTMTILSKLFNQFNEHVNAMKEEMARPDFTKGEK